MLETLAALERPAVEGVRWSTPEQWHVTLRFLGSVDEAVMPAVMEALGGLSSSAVGAELGPTTRRFGRTVLMVPVAGLEAVVAEVRARMVAFEARPDDRPFVGHVTLARGRGGSHVPKTLAGVALSASWLVREVDLVQSRTIRRIAADNPAESTGAEYRVVESFALEGA